MKVLHLSTADANGGAAKGAYLMHKALLNAGVDSHMLVADKFTGDRTVTGSPGITGSQKVLKGIRQTVEYWPLKRYKSKKPGAFSPAVYLNNIAAQVEAIDPDIINLHWVAGGLLRPSDLQKFQQTRHRHLVWTLRDMWAFTGGCHYASTCNAYTKNCGHCPALDSQKAKDLSRQTWNRKQSAWKDLTIHVTPLSHWLADCARQSSLFSRQPIQVIPNAIDAETYRPIDKATARNLLRLSPSKKLILFGALSPTADPRKGFSYLRTALQHLSTQSKPYEAVIFGTHKPQQDLGLSLPTTFLGYLSDDITLALAYSAADVTVIPSIQDNFAKTTIESMACGTPIVAFNATGAKDVIVHKQNGYAATCYEAEDLAKGIHWILEDSDRWKALSARARQTVEDNFTTTLQAERYKQLYTQLAAKTTGSVN